VSIKLFYDLENILLFVLSSTEISLPSYLVNWQCKNRLGVDESTAIRLFATDVKLRMILGNHRSWGEHSGSFSCGHRRDHMKVGI